MAHPLESFLFCPRCGSSSFHEHNFNSKKCEKCGFTYYFNPRAAVVAIITNKDGDLLVCRRAKNPAKGTLDLPGGFSDSYETAEEAVKREVNEETGLETESTQYLFSLPNIYTYSGFDVHTMDLFFKCQTQNLDCLKAADDAAETFFIPIREIDPELFGLSSIRKGIKKLLADKLL